MQQNREWCSNYYCHYCTSICDAATHTLFDIKHFFLLCVRCSLGLPALLLSTTNYLIYVYPLGNGPDAHVPRRPHIAPAVGARRRWRRRTRRSLVLGASQRSSASSYAPPRTGYLCRDPGGDSTTRVAGNDSKCQRKWRHFGENVRAGAVQHKGTMTSRTQHAGG